MFCQIKVSLLRIGEIFKNIPCFKYQRQRVSCIEKNIVKHKSILYRVSIILLKSIFPCQAYDRIPFQWNLILHYYITFHFISDSFIQGCSSLSKKRAIIKKEGSLNVMCSLISLYFPAIKEIIKIYLRGEIILKANIKKQERAKTSRKLKHISSSYFLAQGKMREAGAVPEIIIILYDSEGYHLLKSKIIQGRNRKRHDFLKRRNT